MKRVLQYLFIALIFIPASVFAQQGKADSLKKISVDELLQLRRQLLDRQQKLREIQQKLRGKGVQISKDFLTKTRAENENQDRILVRIAEYYIEQAENEYDQRMENYYKQLEEFDRLYQEYTEGKIKTEPKEPEMPKLDYSKAIEIYDLLLNNFPESELADDALYNKAFLLEKMDQGRRARMHYQELIDKYPDSPFVVEAYMHLAEYYFNPRIDKDREQNIIELEKAIRLYKKVLDFKNTKRYDEALYKLGWSYYRLAAVNPDYFNDAIIYFLAVVRDIENARKLDPEEKISNVDVEPEALQYIGICFADETYPKNGVNNCVAFLEKLGYPDYGVEILRNLGETYAKIEQMQDAIMAFERLLNLYPDYKYAPQMQKNIADIYYKLDQLDSAFNANQKLFENYNPNSEWYLSYQQKETREKYDILDQAYKLSEEALRSNIVYVLNSAQEIESVRPEEAKQKYELLVSLSNKYLETFPTDPNAYEINWSLALVLDTKLQQLEDAYEEYLKVANDYLENKYREPAAVNAIVVADSLVKAEKRLTMAEDTVKIEGLEGKAAPPTELTEAEKRLAEAYDNYIKLFPNGEKTPEILVAAGGLYYEHRQFEKAKIYYRTLVTRFPEAKEKDIALFSTMNTYFQLGQYVDAEYIARKILESPNIPEEKKEIAKKRIAESIFKNAEKLEGQQNYIEAGYEYLRVYKDAPDDKRFVDLAMFKAGVMFDKAEQYTKAIEAYQLLADTFPKSKYAIPALESIAEDYKILEDYNKVASTYEEIFKRYPSEDRAEAALYNASYYYEQAKNWEEAIRVNNIYVNTYPDSPDAKDLYFHNASLYLKLDRVEDANEIYKDFAARFPDDPRVIEAFYERGKYYFDKENYDLAKVEFNKAIAKSEEFRRQGKNPNAPIAAEAMYSLSEILFKDFENIKFAYPESKLRLSIQQKKNLLVELEKLYRKIIGYGSIRAFEAMFKMAYIYESLANSISNPEFPSDMSLTDKIAAKTKMLETSVAFFERAIKEYKNVITAIPKLADKMGIDLYAQEDTTRTLAFEDTISSLKKVSIEDSTKKVALKWLERSREKVSEVLYTMAQRNASIILDVVNAPNPYPPLSWEYVLYQEQLIKVIVPKINITIKAHVRNIEESKALGLDNKYVKESERKILQASNIIPEIYSFALNKTFEQYESLIKRFDNLINEGADAADETGKTYFDYYDAIQNIIDYFGTFHDAAANGYANTLKLAEKFQIRNDIYSTTLNNIMQLSYEASARIKNYMDSTQVLQQKYTALFDSNQTMINYQDGSIFYSDFNAQLRDYYNHVLEYAFDKHEEFGIDNYWYKLILAQLIRINPQKYLANLPREQKIIVSDETWKVSNKYDPGFAYLDFDDSQWQNAAIVAEDVSGGVSAFDTLNVKVPGIWLYPYGVPKDTAGIADTLLIGATSDTTGMQDTTMKVAAIDYAALDTTDSAFAYFRKWFELPAKPIKALMLVTADNDFRLYINEEYIIDDFDNQYEISEKMELVDLQDFVKVGKNLIAIDVIDSDGKPRRGLRFYLIFEMMPRELESTIAKMKRIEEKVKDKQKMRISSILNLNRVVH
jgi:TolA-binding protein